LSIRLFHKLGSDVSRESYTNYGNINLTSQIARAVYEATFAQDDPPAVTEIPCSYIATASEDDWDFSLCILGF
jgi:hypothetical protein